MKQRVMLILVSETVVSAYAIPELMVDGKAIEEQLFSLNIG